MPTSAENQTADNQTADNQTADNQVVDTQVDKQAEVTGLALQALKDSTLHAFQVMTGLDATLGPEFLQETPSSAQRSISGVIGWGGEWTGIFDCSPEFATMLANLMLGTEHTTLSEDSLDAIAEMTNIIFGGMKSTIEASLGHMNLSTPTVIFGNHVGMRGARDGCTVIPVGVLEHSLSVKFFITRTDEKRNSPSHFWAATGHAPR